MISRNQGGQLCIASRTRRREFGHPREEPGPNNEISGVSQIRDTTVMRLSHISFVQLEITRSATTP